MKVRLNLVTVLLFLISTVASAQFNILHRAKADTVITLPGLHKKQSFIRSRAFQNAVAAPVFLTTAGMIVFTDNDVLDRFQLEEERNEWIPKFRHHADDYLQYSPIAIAYGLDALGIKSKNDFANRTAMLLKAELMVGVSVYTLKRITAVPRPDTGQRTSFPSGHTAQAFAAATFMAKEYGGKSIFYTIGAYSLATGIGAMRVMNNRHWASDVLVGAGIGILSTNLVYLTHQYKWGKNHHRKTHETVVIPDFGNGAGVYVSYKL
jgi:membrane-associated phospholipid phosphatase